MRIFSYSPAQSFMANKKYFLLIKTIIGYDTTFMQFVIRNFYVPHAVQIYNTNTSASASASTRRYYCAVLHVY